MSLARQTPPETNETVSSNPHLFTDAHFDGLNRTNGYMMVRFRIMFRLLSSGKLSLRKIFNAVYSYIAYFLRLKTAAKSPFLINFELWNDCNEACVFCRSARGEIYNTNPADKNPVAKGKLPLDVYKSIIDQASPYMLLSVPYVNGEPLLSKDVYAAIQHATDKKVGTLIATNGMILNEANSQKLLDAGLDFLKIHISGFTQDIHKIQHRKGNVETIKRNIEKFVELNHKGKHGTIVMLDYIKYNHNTHEIAAAADFAERLGIMFNLRPGNPRGMEDTESPQGSKPLPVDVPCDWLWTVLTVDWNTNVYPCCDHVTWSNAPAYEQFQAGVSDILKVWNGEKAQAMRTIHATKGRKPLPICAECPRQGVTFKW